MSSDHIHAGGPPFTCDDTSPHCGTETAQLYKDVQKSIDCVINDKSYCVKPGSLAYAVKIPNIKPISCMLDLLTGHFSDCNVNIPPEKLAEALNVFKSMTGYVPLNITKFFDDLQTHQISTLNFTAFYIFMPVLILTLLLILFMITYKFINWIDGLYLGVLALIVLYGFDILFRRQASTYIDNKLSMLEQDAINAQTNYENSISHWPQAFFGMACALTSKDGKAWTCNNKCEPCFRPSNLKPCNKKKKHRKPCDTKPKPCDMKPKPCDNDKPCIPIDNSAPSHSDTTSYSDDDDNND
jgi:hypothetical protein